MEGYTSVTFNTDGSINAYTVDQTVIPAYTDPDEETFVYLLGNKSYELKNHLGNVLAVVTDRKLALDANSDGVVDGYTADVISYSDYYPFGMVMPGRSGNDATYRYGFNGMEKDDEMHGQTGSSYDFGARLYDSRIARWTSRDPLFKTQPSQSPYKAFLNNPLIFIDPQGETEYLQVIIYDQRTGRIAISDKWVGDKYALMTDGVANRNRSGTCYMCSRGRDFNYYNYETTVLIVVDKNGIEHSKMVSKIIGKPVDTDTYDYMSKSQPKKGGKKLDYEAMHRDGFSGWGGYAFYGSDESVRYKTYDRNGESIDVGDALIAAGPKAKSKFKYGSTSRNDALEAVSDVLTEAIEPTEVEIEAARIEQTKLDSFDYEYKHMSSEGKHVGSSYYRISEYDYKYRIFEAQRRIHKDSVDETKSPPPH